MRNSLVGLLAHCSKHVVANQLDAGSGRSYRGVAVMTPVVDLFCNPFALSVLDFDRPRRIVGCAAITLFRLHLPSFPFCPALRDVLADRDRIATSYLPIMSAQPTAGGWNSAF